MKICGIVCEYNPFHNGHKYQIDVIKKNRGYDAVIGIMSGNYTQRGDIALFDKNIRARAAVLNGMDLVLELPTVYAVQTAERFAFNSVYILNSLGIIDGLAFGTECEDIKKLKIIASLLTNETAEYSSALKYELSLGKPYFSARSSAIARVLGSEYSVLLSEPNNILAIEYIKCLNKLNSKIKPELIKRHISRHNDIDINGTIASATAVRRELPRNKTEALNAVPKNLRDIYTDAKIHDIEKLGSAIISNILLSDANTIKNTPDVNEGLQNKIKSAAFISRSFNELCGNIKSKRYAHSRIRRILINCFLGITNDDTNKLPQYIKILDFNKQGQNLLHIAKNTASLPLAKNRNGIKNNPAAIEAWDRELVFDSIYNLT